MKMQKVKWASVYMERGKMLQLAADRSHLGYMLSHRMSDLLLICPEEIDAGEYYFQFDPDVKKGISWLVYVVEGQDGSAHVEPFWAAPGRKELPEGFKWGDGGALVEIGHRKESKSLEGRYTNERICLPLHDRVIKNNGEVADEMGSYLEELWRAPVWISCEEAEKDSE